MNVDKLLRLAESIKSGELCRFGIGYYQACHYVRKAPPEFDQYNMHPYVCDVVASIPGWTILLNVLDTGFMSMEEAKTKYVNWCGYSTAADEILNLEGGNNLYITSTKYITPVRAAEVIVNLVYQYNQGIRNPYAKW